MKKFFMLATLLALHNSYGQDQQHSKPYYPNPANPRPLHESPLQQSYQRFKLAPVDPVTGRLLSDSIVPEINHLPYQSYSTPPQSVSIHSPLPSAPEYPVIEQKSSKKPPYIPPYIPKEPKESEYDYTEPFRSRAQTSFSKKTEPIYAVPQSKSNQQPFYPNDDLDTLAKQGNYEPRYEIIQPQRRILSSIDSHPSFSHTELESIEEDDHEVFSQSDSMITQQEKGHRRQRSASDPYSLVSQSAVILADQSFEKIRKTSQQLQSEALDKIHKTQHTPFAQPKLNVFQKAKKAFLSKEEKTAYMLALASKKKREEIKPIEHQLFATVGVLSKVASDNQKVLKKMPSTSSDKL